MSNLERKWSLIAAGLTVLLLVFAVGCRGFFVNQPTSVTVTPNAPSLAGGQTQGFTAQAAFSDNTTKDVTSSATWSTSNPCIVAIIATGNGAGNATAVGTGGSATITASFNGVSGTATPTAPTGLLISPCQPQKAVSSAGGTFPQVVFQLSQGGITFTAASGGNNVAATWTSSHTNVATFQNPSTGDATFVGAGQTTITATSSSETGSLTIVLQ